MYSELNGMLRPFCHTLSTSGRGGCPRSVEAEMAESRGENSHWHPQPVAHII